MLIDYLQKLFAERSRKNAKYSLRAFASSLDIDSSTLSALLRRKRPMTSKMAMKIIDRLDIQDPLQVQMLLMGSLAGGGGANAKHVPYNEFDMATAEVISSWEHFAILTTLELPRFKGDTKAIAKRLNIPMGVAMEALYRMEKLGIIAKENTYWKLTGKNMATPSNIPNSRLRQSHRQHIERALESLDHDAVEIRDITGITMAIKSNKINEAKHLIQDFRRRLSTFLETGTCDSVYRLNVQLFPLTQENPK